MQILVELLYGKWSSMETGFLVDDELRMKPLNNTEDDICIRPKGVVLVLVKA
jgi:hypothetical protein